jgi:hypothetical protein
MRLSNHEARGWMCKGVDLFGETPSSLDVKQINKVWQIESDPYH